MTDKQKSIFSDLDALREETKKMWEEMDAEYARKVAEARAARSGNVERTGWRDQRISARHRTWGYDCPAIDIDFLLLEYTKGAPVALVEYKHEKAKLQDSSHPSYRAIATLGASANVPFFGVRYLDDFSNYTVTPLNKVALRYIDRAVVMSECQYVDFLRKLRQQKRMQL